jgi:ATP-dependent HslUV protease ATP-binding subunit HslU
MTSLAVTSLRSKITCTSKLFHKNLRSICASSNLIRQQQQFSSNVRCYSSSEGDETGSGSKKSKRKERDDDEDNDEDDEGMDELYKKYDLLKDLDTRQELKNVMQPKQIVEELNRHIVGQNDAKRAVAIALRNRWRRHQLPDNLKNEVLPKNILMIGPTGSGKTEVARRMAKIVNAPFIKVEATKFTEVGFHGKDVDTIIKDLVDIAIQQTRVKLKEILKEKVQKIVEERILNILLGNKEGSTRESFAKLLRSGELDDREIEIEIPDRPPQRGGFPGFMGGGDNVMVAPFDVSGLVYRLENMFGRKSKTRRMKIGKCKPLLEDIELDRMLNMDIVVKEAIRAVEQDGVVVIDEVDKICTSYSDSHDASAEGVQRDLLPLIEGTTITTKYGNVKTDHILFIASGAFHSVKPADMLAELQGRLPIRVELKALTEADLYRILTEPENNLLRQNIELMKTEKVTLQFEDAAIREIAAVAAELNSTVENIGARRLITVVEKLLEEVSFNAPEMADQTVVMKKEDVRKYVGELIKKSDLSKFVL